MTLPGPFKILGTAATVAGLFIGSAAIAGAVTGQTTPDTTTTASVAAITADQASTAAQAVVPGDVISVELENENGAVVYGVEIGTSDVKVDAGNGNVLHIDAGND